MDGEGISEEIFFFFEAIIFKELLIIREVISGIKRIGFLESMDEQSESLFLREV